MCDLAETYGVLDWSALPVKTLAALAAGLGDNSRTKMKIEGRKVSRVELLLASIADKLSTLIWFQTEDGHNGENRPRSVLSFFLGEAEPEEEGDGFDTAEEFEETWAAITGVKHGR